MPDAANERPGMSDGVCGRRGVRMLCTDVQLAGMDWGWDVQGARWEVRSRLGRCNSVVVVFLCLLFVFAYCGWYVLWWMVGKGGYG
jgi:hypothetical protein